MIDTTCPPPNALPVCALSGTECFQLDRLGQVITGLGFSDYTNNVRGNTLNMFVYTLSLMIGTAGLPHVIIRFFTVPKVKDARSSAGWALVFIAILYTTAPAVAAMARLNLHNTIAPPNAEQNLAYEERPQWFKNWENTGLLPLKTKMAMVVFSTPQMPIPMKW